MMLSTFYYNLFLSIALASKAHGDEKCAPYPVSLKVGNVTLSNGQIARGVELGVGTPPQPMAFLPQWPLNNSFVYGTTGFCEAVSPGWTADGCTTLRGGAYDPGRSSTQRGGAASAFAPDAGPYPALTELSDAVALGANATSAGLRLPLGVALGDWGEQAYHPQAALGLGANSTLLAALVGAWAAASRTWSWFWGLDGPAGAAQLRGSLVLGGYDRARVSGAGYTQSISSDTGRCASGLVVALTDVVVGFANGTTASIFPGGASTALAACLDPAYPTLMTIPLDPYWIAFESLTNSSITGRSDGLNWYDMRYDAGATPFDGDLTLEFSSGLSVRVANAQLVGPDVAIDQATGALAADAARPVVAMNALQDANAGDVITIGRNLFSAAYVMANYDAGLFTMWAASLAARDEDLVAVDAAGAEVASFCAAGSGGATVTAGGAASSPVTGGPISAADSGVASTSPRSRVGEIVGGVVGGLAGAFVLSSFAVFMLRRMTARRGRRSDDTYFRDDHSPHDPKAPNIGVSAKASKDDLIFESQQPKSLGPQELAASEHRSYSYELPIEME